MKLDDLVEMPPWDWPREAGAIIRKALNDQSASEDDRVTAAELAGDMVVINDELANDLLAIIGNAGEPELVRGKAAIALGPVLEQTDADGFEDDPLGRLEAPPITEFTFQKIRNTLRKHYEDASVPKFVRRRILEASVRAADSWHRDAVGNAFSSGDRDWMLTAVFSMQYVRGSFDDQILAALQSADPEIHRHAVRAAGASELDAAWPHIWKLLRDSRTPKPLRIAAIGAAAGIRPAEAEPELLDLAGSKDEEIAEAAEEALLMTPVSDDEDEDEDID